MDISIKQLQMLLALRDNNFSMEETASSMMIGYSTFSRNIRNLESFLEIKILFRKGTKIIGLTDAGENIIKIAEDIVSKSYEIKKITSNYNNSLLEE